MQIDTQYFYSEEFITFNDIHCHKAASDSLMWIQSPNEDTRDNGVKKKPG